MIVDPLPRVTAQVVDELEAAASRVLRPVARRGGHVRTDPACRLYREPAGRLSSWWHDSNRGLACPTCRPRRLVALPTPRRRHDDPAPTRPIVAGEWCVRTIDRLTCSTHGEPWPCPELGLRPGAMHDDEGGPCPAGCGRFIADVLLAGHLALHRRGAAGGGR